MPEQIEDFKESFQMEFGIEFPLHIPADVSSQDSGSFTTYGVRPDKSLIKPGPYLLRNVLLTPIARQRTYKDQAHIENFLQEAPEGYFYTGFWGHGVNSHAFYYSVVNQWERIFLRLPYGGLYMNNEEGAEYVKKVLTKFSDLERLVEGKVRKLIIVDSMSFGLHKSGSGKYKIVGNNGKSMQDDEYAPSSENYNEMQRLVLNS